MDQTSFGGIIRLYGQKNAEKITNSKVMVIGLGGVGSWAAEALARSGVGTIFLVDLDDICITNVNRQLCATTETVGKMKIDVLKSRILAINPNCNVVAIPDFYTKNSSANILNHQPDFVIDAIDSLDNKCLLISECEKLHIPIIVTGGAAGKIDPTLIKIDDLAFSFNDNLLQRVRKKLRRDYGFKRPIGQTLKSRKKMGINCIYSPEEQRFPHSNGDVCATPEPGSNTKMDCESGMGSITHITGTFGFFAAAAVLKKITD